METALVQKALFRPHYRKRPAEAAGSSSAAKYVWYQHGFEIPRRVPEPRDRTDYPHDRRSPPHAPKEKKAKSSKESRPNKEGHKGNKGSKPKGGGKCEYISPSSFSHAWSTFFSPQAIMLVCSLGLVTDIIPNLSLLDIGGRLGMCVAAWKSITDNKWVRNIV